MDLTEAAKLINKLNLFQVRILNDLALDGNSLVLLGVTTQGEGSGITSSELNDLGIMLRSMTAADIEKVYLIQKETYTPPPFIVTGGIVPTK